MRKIVILNRKRTSDKNSIEELFLSLKPYLNYNKFIEVPAFKANFSSIFKNILYSIKNKGHITHVSGDIHYVSIFTGSKTILSIHDIQSTLSKGSFFAKKIKFLLWFYLPAMRVKKITVISEFTKMELSKIIPYYKNKIVVIPNPFNERIQYISKIFNHDYPVILHIGTKENKNLIRTIKALNGIPCRLIIIGLLSDFQLRHLDIYNIDFINKYNIPYEELIEFYASCDIVSFCSTYEGFGMPILEANKAGRVIITSNICSMPFVSNNSACLVDPFDVSDIKNGFLKIINNKEYRESLISNGFSNLDRFHPQVIANQYNQLYNSL